MLIWRIDTIYREKPFVYFQAKRHFSGLLALGTLVYLPYKYWPDEFRLVGLNQEKEPIRIPIRSITRIRCSFVAYEKGIPTILKHHQISNPDTFVKLKQAIRL